MSTTSVNPEDIKIPASMLGKDFEGVLGIARKGVEQSKDEPKKQKETLDPQAYENALNELAVSMGESVNGRSLVGINGSERHRELFKALVQYKLKEQAKDGKQVSVEAAMEDATSDLRGRYENAVGGGKDGKHKLNVLDGYWDRQAGKKNAADLAVHAYSEYFSENPPNTGKAITKII